MSAARRPQLRPYQADSVGWIREAFAQGLFRVLFVLPTGGGKTIIFAEITSHAAAKGNRVIILAHRQEIADQISSALWQMGVLHGRIQPGHPMADQPVQVGMVQTVARRLTSITEPKLLIIDEAHHVVAGTWAKVIAAWPHAKVLGVTATPERLDGRGLGDVFQTMVCGPDMRELIVAGYLARFRYFAPPSTSIDLTGVCDIGGDYDPRGLEQVLDKGSITGDVVKHYRTYLGGRTAIVFCATVPHAEHVALQFRDSGIAAASIDGKMPTDRRRSMVDALRTGAIRVLTSCDLVSEGFDLPTVGGAILLRPTKSFALYRQQVGRCLRPKTDGSAAIVLDHVGNARQHGLPDAPHEWLLHSKRRKADQTQQRGGNLRTCSACNAVFATDTGRAQCPTSGFEGCLFGSPDVPVEREGELEEVVSPDWAAGTVLGDARGAELRRLVEDAAGDPDKLRQIQTAKGYKSGWVYYKVLEAAQKRLAPL